MEFFTRALSRLSSSDLQQQIRIDNLPGWCGAIEQSSADSSERGNIYCLWGEFKIHREIIRDGIRFSLPGCPNALQWTLTADRERPDEIGLHLTINQPRIDTDFHQSINDFLAAWKAGLEYRAKNPPPPKAPTGEESPMFGGFG